MFHPELTVLLFLALVAAGLRLMTRRSREPIAATARRRKEWTR